MYEQVNNLFKGLSTKITFFLHWMLEREVASGGSYWVHCAHEFRVSHVQHLLYFLIDSSSFFFFSQRWLSGVQSQTNPLSLGYSFACRSFCLQKEEVKGGNKVWHVDSRLNFPGGPNGQLLKFNCSPCQLEERCERWWVRATVGRRSGGEREASARLTPACKRLAERSTNFPPRWLSLSQRLLVHQK